MGGFIKMGQGLESREIGGPRREIKAWYGRSKLMGTTSD